MRLIWVQVQLCFYFIMNNKRREFIDRLLRISELNEELLEFGDRGKQPAFTKRIQLIQMGRAQFNLPSQTQPLHVPRHNCKVLVLDSTRPRYRAPAHQRNQTTQGLNDSRPCSLRPPSSQGRTTQQQQESINFVSPMECQIKSQLLRHMADLPTGRPQSHRPARKANSAKNLCESDTQAILSSPSPLVSGQALRLQRTATVSVQRQKKAEDQRKAKLARIKEIHKNYAGPFTPPPKLTAKSYIVCEVSGDGLRPIVCFNSKNSQEVASLTKIMTCLVVIELAERLQIHLDQEEVKIGKYEASIGGTSAQLRAGQILTVRQLLYALMLPSGNDASLALAVWAGRRLLAESNDEGDGSNQFPRPKSHCYMRFVREMNLKAKQVGMNKTRYANSHGLANPNNRSTAYDIALLCHHAMQKPLFREVVSCPSFHTQVRLQNEQSMNPEEVYSDNCEDDIDSLTEKSESPTNAPSRNSNKSPLRERISPSTETLSWQNTHKLLQTKPDDYIGIKTGITNSAGPCLSSMVVSRGRQFIIVVLGCAKMGLRFKETEILRRWVLKHEGISKTVRKTTSLKLDPPPGSSSDSQQEEQSNHIV